MSIEEEVKQEKSLVRRAEVERLEIDLLMEGIYRMYGYDFRNYAYPSIRRRVLHRMQAMRLGSISALQAQVLHDPQAMEFLLGGLMINVTEMYRDPDVFREFRSKVVPILRTYPFIRIWHAGCSTGEEVYSMAVLLHEEGLYEKCRIYATDMSEEALKKAQEGRFPLRKMKQYTKNYQLAGGTGSFSEYYKAREDVVEFDAQLKKHLVFAQHNLVTDQSFNEFNVIFCRNVLIYFDKTLQDRVHRLFYDSLSMFGVLALGNRESINFSHHADCYAAVDSREKIYRKIK